jgi:hypothetical protein
MSVSLENDSGKRTLWYKFCEKLVSCNEIRTLQCNNISELFYYKNL